MRYYNPVQTIPKLRSLEKKRKEVNSRALRPLLLYAESQLGEEVVQRLIEASDLEKSYLNDEKNWVSNDVYYFFLDQVTALTENPRAPFEAGKLASTREAAGSFFPLFTSLGKISFLYEKAAQVTPSYARSLVVRLLEIRKNKAEIWAHDVAGFPSSVNSCAYRKGVFSGLPVLLGGLPALCVEKECQAQGAPACLYEFRWKNPARLYGSLLGLLLGGAAALGYGGVKKISLSAPSADLLFALCLPVIGFLAGWIRDLGKTLKERAGLAQEEEETLERNISVREKDYEELHESASDLRAALEEVKENYKGTIFSLVHALEARDHYTIGHSARVAGLSIKIARALGVDPAEFEAIENGALLHDIGKIGVSDTLLLKPGKLTEEERESVKKHALIGYGIVKNVKFLSNYASIVKYHHEYYDGKGYPEGLKEEEIPLGARIVAAADAFDTLISDRCYRPALKRPEALKILEEASGRQFDPACVHALQKAL